MTIPLDDSPRVYSPVIEIEDNTTDVLKKTQNAFQARELKVPQVDWTKQKIIKTILFIPLFPLILSWKVTTFAIGKICLHTFLKNKILPIINKTKSIEEYKSKLPEKREQAIKFDKFSRINPLTPDEIQLDGVICWRNQELKNRYNLYENSIENFNLKNENFILYLCGSNECYEEKLDFAKQYGDDTDSNVLIFNYREVMESKGIVNNTMDLVLDAHTMYKFLNEYLKIPQDRIFIHAYEIGGGVGATMASLNKAKGIEIDRSSKDLSALPSNEVLPYSRILSKIVYFITKEVLTTVNCELDTVQALNKLKDRVLDCDISFATSSNIVHRSTCAYRGMKEALEDYKKIPKDIKKDLIQLDDLNNYRLEFIKTLNEKQDKLGQKLNSKDINNESEYLKNANNKLLELINKLEVENEEETICFENYIENISKSLEEYKTSFNDYCQIAGENKITDELDKYIKCLQLDHKYPETNKYNQRYRRNKEIKSSIKKFKYTTISHKDSFTAEIETYNKNLEHIRNYFSKAKS